MAAIESWMRVAIALVPVGLFLWLSVRSGRRRPPGRGLVPDGPPDAPYEVYTRAYDLELHARDVLAQLAQASPDERNGYLKSVAHWRLALTELKDSIAEHDLINEPDPDESVRRLRAVAGDIAPEDLVVTLLIDQSGSMKGTSIASAATTAAFLTQRLHDFGAKSEVLGFTTAGWKGGWAREQWVEDGKPPRPGRLCALMHIVYKSTEEPALSDESRRIMVHPDLLRENVDGEAILWARERLAARPEPHKLLIVISDGAPVDDSTLTENGPSFLFRHLMTVIRETEGDPRFVVGAVGLGHDVDACYWLARTARTPLHLWNATGELLEEMLVTARDRLEGRS